MVVVWFGGWEGMCYMHTSRCLLIIFFYRGHFRKTFSGKENIKCSKQRQTIRVRPGEGETNGRKEGKRRKELTNGCTFTSVLSMPCTAGVHDYTLPHKHTFVLHLTKNKKR